METEKKRLKEVLELALKMSETLVGIDKKDLVGARKAAYDALFDNPGLYTNNKYMYMLHGLSVLVELKELLEMDVLAPSWSARDLDHRKKGRPTHA